MIMNMIRLYSCEKFKKSPSLVHYTLLPLILLGWLLLRWLMLVWLLLSIFSDFQQVKKLIYFAGFEQVKKTNSKTLIGETGCLCIFCLGLAFFCCFLNTRHPFF